MAHVLILNPDESACEGLAKKLAEGSHRATCCRWPHQALRRARLLNFDLAWMSWPPAGMDGVNFLQRLWMVQPELPVVLLEQGESISPELRRQLKGLGVRMILQREPKTPLVLAITAVCARRLPPAPSGSA